MVNEAIATIPHFFDYDSSDGVKAKNSNSGSQKNTLQRSSSGLVVDHKEKHYQSKQDSIAEAFDALLPKSAENLSWKFFEQVSSLDNQLRNDETNVLHINGSQLMTSLKNSSSHDNFVVNGNIGQEIQTDTFGKSNGFMPGATKKLSSQHSPDLVQHQQQQQSRHATFQFTSPTATFKRRKQQQQHQEKQQQQQTHQQQINNNYNCSDKNQLLATTPCKSGGSNCIANQTYTLHPPLTPQPQQQQSKHKHQHHNHQQDHRQYQQHAFNHNDNDDDFNEVATTAMISEPGVIINSDTTTTGTGISTGTGTTHSLKTRTLPTVSVATAYAVDTASAVRDNDDNDGDNCNNSRIPKTYQQSNQQKRSAQRHSRQKQKRMGATLQHSADSFVDGIEQHFSLIGWRKKCLYTLLALLLVLVIINLVLTLWILKVMEFSADGMGLLKIVPGGIQLTGQAVIMDMLRASTIRSRHGQPITIESSRNFSINTRDTNGMLENHLFLGHDKLECLSTGFRINDTAGRNLFSVNRNEVTIGAHALRIDGEGGAIFRESIQTPHVRAEPGRELRLESPTRQLEIAAARDINLQSRAGGIELSAQDEIKLSTLDGSLRFESTKILMPYLRTAPSPTPSTIQNHEHISHRVYQLCACANGKLFLTAPHSICAGDDTTVCR